MLAARRESEQLVWMTLACKHLYTHTYKSKHWEVMCILVNKALRCYGTIFDVRRQEQTIIVPSKGFEIIKTVIGYIAHSC